MPTPWFPHIPSETDVPDGEEVLTALILMPNEVFFALDLIGNPSLDDALTGFIDAYYATGGSPSVETCLHAATALEQLIALAVQPKKGESYG